jgi:hypothetical protein
MIPSPSNPELLFPPYFLLWSFELQSEVTLFTTEAKYISFTQATCDHIPMHSLLFELSSTTKLTVGISTAYSTIFEDNKGCAELTNAAHLNPHIQYLGICYQHFPSHIHQATSRSNFLHNILLG